MHLKLRSKKTISLLLAALLAFAMLPTAIISYALPGDYSFSEETGELNINTTAGITAWTSEVAAADVKSVTISEAVTEINSSAFQGLINLESVTFEGNISLTAGGIFAGATALKSIVFNGESSLSAGAFNNALNIETITFGGKTKIVSSLFANSSKLTELTFPAGSTFGAGSFSNCSALEKVTFEGDVDLSVGGIFSGATALKTLVFKGESKISNGAFSGSSNLESISFGGKTDVTNGVFSDNSKLTELTFPAGSTFGPSVFYNCTALEKVTFEGNVDITSGGAFSGSTAPKTLVFNGESKISSGAFFNTGNLETISFGGKTQLGAGLFRYISNLTELTIPAGSTLGASAFSDCTALEKVTFEGDVDLTAGSVFSNTTGLKEIVFNGESKLGNSSFANAENLKTITFAKKTSLASGAFNGIGTALQDKTDVIVLPEGSTVSGNAFCDSNLSGVRFMDKTPQDFGANTFYDCADGAIIYVPCVSVDAYTTALNGGENPANPKGYAIQGVHTFIDGVCECGELAPVMPVTVIDGSGSGDYYEGAIVTIEANTPAQGKVFDKWEVVSGDITLDSATSATATFIMPANAVEIKATYKDSEPSHIHNTDTTKWENDETDHWNQCECGEQLNKSAHTFEWVIDSEATATEKGSKHQECTVCGYKKATVEIPATGSTDNPSKPAAMTSPETGDNSIMWLWGAIMLVSGVVFAGTAVYGKKKRAK
ncbi:MAG: leucine-rich repeat protein [Eubacterium sp.]